MSKVRKLRLATVSKNFAASLVCSVITLCTGINNGADAQVSQYGRQDRTQLALATPNVGSNLQMLRAEASVLFNASQYAAAAQAYSRLIQLGSTESADRYWLGESLYHSAFYEQAASAFEQAIQMNATNELPYPRLAETYIALHQKEKAKQVCEKGLHVVIDTYRHQQLETLMKVSMFQERKPVRTRESRLSKLPSES